jgi:hypothetical protein
MPNLVIMNNQLIRKLAVLRTDWQAQGQVAFLYQNDHTPGPSDTAAAYMPATYDGASGRPVHWTNLPILAGNGVAYMRGETLVFQPTATSIASQVYGYYVLSTREPGVLVYAQRFDGAPFVIGNTLDPISVVPEWRDQAIPDE